MNEYFSDRETGLKPQMLVHIDMSVWQALISLIEQRISDGSLGYKFPRYCEDGDDVCGTNSNDFWVRAKAEVPDVFPTKQELAQEDDPFAKRYRTQPSIPSDSVLPNTIAILDFLEFVAKNMGLVGSRSYHPYWKHYDLSFDRDAGDAGLENFKNEINTIFRRNQIAFEMDENGKIQRVLGAAVGHAIGRMHFQTGDEDLNNLLNRAVDHFLKPDSQARQDALEKIWDAFERLKTLGPGKDKKTQVNALVSSISHDSQFLKIQLDAEFNALTEIGNETRIRHSETNRENIPDDEWREYLFMRMHSLIVLALSKQNKSGIGR